MKNKLLLTIAIIALIGFSTTACDPGGDDEVIYELGDTGPGGGIIFYRDLSGFTVQGHESFGSSYTAKYLEAAPSNSGTDVQWSADTTLIGNGLTTNGTLPAPEPFASTIGNGRKDTRIIIAHLGNNESGTAAQLAGAASFGGFSDWFLPSIGELKELYIYWESNGKPDNLDPTGWYWSSSQYNSSFAWDLRFSIGAQLDSNKGVTNIVRAVRAF